MNDINIDLLEFRNHSSFFFLCVCVCVCVGGGGGGGIDLTSVSTLICNIVSRG